MARRNKKRVTDHAVLRYLERMCYVDVEAIREVIDQETREASNSGASRIRKNGIDYRIRNGTVVTLMPLRPNSKGLNWKNKK